MHGRALHIAFCMLVVTAVAACGPQADAETVPHPDRSAAAVEYFIRRPSTPGPWPTIVLLHGQQNGLVRPGGEAYVDFGVLDQYAREGYLAVAVSLPGYGGSTGPADFAGPFTVDAVAGVIGKLEADGQILPGKLVVEGVSLGAVTGALLATQDPDVTGLVLISGLYDFTTFFERPKSAGAAAVKRVITAQTGGGAEALRARSALFRAGEIKASALILNGALDDRTDPDQAVKFAEAIRANGGRAEVQVFPELGHEIRYNLRKARVEAFVRDTLGR